MLCIYVLKDKGVSLHDFKSEVAGPLNMKLIEEEVDFSKAEWTGKIMSTKEIGKYTSRIAEDHGYNVDIVMCFIDRKNWKSSQLNLYGVHYYKVLNTYEIAIVRERSKDEVTAYHEILHALDDIIYTETGVRLETVFGVTDFDNDVVHGGHPNYKYVRSLDESHMEIYNRVLPYLTPALNKRRLKYKLVNKALSLMALLRAHIAKMGKKAELINE